MFGRQDADFHARQNSLDWIGLDWIGLDSTFSKIQLSSYCNSILKTYVLKLKGNILQLVNRFVMLSVFSKFLFWENTLLAQHSHFLA